MSNYALTVGGRPYPQRQNWTEAGWLDRQFEKLRTFMLSKWWSREAHMARFVRKVHASYDELERLSQDELAQRLQAVKRDLRRFGPVDDVAARAFALIRWHSKQTLGLAHFDSQICGLCAHSRHHCGNGHGGGQDTHRHPGREYAGHGGQLCACHHGERLPGHA